MHLDFPVCMYKWNYIFPGFSLAHVWMLVKYRKFLHIKSILLSGNG